MFFPESKAKASVRAISAPFAVSAAALLLALSALEYARRGFVSLFLDLRIVAGAALAFWIMASASQACGTRKRSLVGSAFACIAFAFAAIVLYRSAHPFGRLGLAVTALGLLGTAVAGASFFFAEKDSRNPNPNP